MFLGKMNLEDRAERYKQRIENGNSKSLASIQSWREYYFTKIHLFGLLDYLLEKDYSAMKDMPKKSVAKRACLGMGEFVFSYPLMIAGFITAIATQNLLKGVPISLLGLLMNWDGEFKISNLYKYCSNNNVQVEDVTNSLFENKP